MYENQRDPTLEITLPDEPFDQHVQFTVGRDAAGDYVIVFDTDNDEDLSDERPVIFPWRGPALDLRDFFAQATPKEMDSMPHFAVKVQLSDGVHVYDSVVRLVIVPHVRTVIPTGRPGDTISIPNYMIGAYQTMVGITSIDGTEYTFWVGSSGNLGQYLRRDAEIWFEKGDQRKTAIDSTQPFAKNPFLVGQVIDLDGRYYRLDDISLDGSKLRLAAVDNMPGVGIRAGMEAPQFRAVTIDGDALALSDSRGKYVLLDFWSTTCGPCLEQLPELRRLYEEFSRDDLEIVGIAEDEPDWLRKFVRDNGITWAQVTQHKRLEGQSDILEAYRVTGIPTYFLIDPDGRVVDPAFVMRPQALEETLTELIGG